MALDVARILALLARDGTLPWALRPVIRRARGLNDVVVDAADVGVVLTDPRPRVPYAARSAMVGLGSFPLALDGDDHGDARDLIAGVLAASNGAHQRGVRAARRVTRDRVSGADDRLDVVGGLVHPALQTWFLQWAGIEDDALGVELHRAAQLVAHATFLVPEAPAWGDRRAELDRVVAGVARRREALSEPVRSAARGTLAGELVAATGDVPTAVDHLLGLTVGPLALGCWALAGVVDELLAAPWVLDSVIDDDDAVAAYRLGLVRRPPLPGVVREVPRMDLGGRRAVGPGRVLAATASVRHRRPGPGGPPDPDALFALVFGAGVHACLGPRQITDVSAVVLHALAPRRPRRLPGRRGRLEGAPPPSGVSSWSFPGRLVVRLTA